MATVEARGEKDVFMLMLAGWSRNAFLWRYPLIVVVYMVPGSLFGYAAQRDIWDFDFLSVFLGVIAMFWIVVFAVMGVTAFVRRKFRLGSALLLAVVIFFSPNLFGIHSDGVFDRIRFHFLKDQYAAVIDKMPADERASSVVFFSWGSNGFLTTNFFYSVVYDESGEIALPDDERTPAWKFRASEHHHVIIAPGCITTAFRLSGHYYSSCTLCQ